jgi:hypothetical protein
VVGFLVLGGNREFLEGEILGDGGCTHGWCGAAGVGGSGGK